MQRWQPGSRRSTILDHRRRNGAREELFVVGGAGGVSGRGSGDSFVNGRGTGGWKYYSSGEVEEKVCCTSAPVMLHSKVHSNITTNAYHRAHRRFSRNSAEELRACQLQSQERFFANNL